ncbi:MAG TPA: hypothetical protein VNE71_00100 [Myxococcota bacterium]|nr:hypothetical protein [Myxococcota bacterium]
MRASRAVALLFALAAAAPSGALAQGAIGDGSARLESAVDAFGDDVERRLEEVSPALAEVARRVRLSGSASFVWLDTQADSPYAGDRYRVWDARLFVDALLLENVDVGGARWLRSAGVTFEWQLYRLGDKDSDIGETYLELQGLGDSSWWNVQLGRFQIPVGEGYLRYSKGARDNPFLSNTVGTPWWPDEGVKLYGSEARGRFGYIASLTNGETRRDFGLDEGDEYTLKLYANPTTWLHLSGSALWSGPMGSDAHPAQSALWLGETWAHPYGGFTGLPSYLDGEPVPPGPGRIDSTFFLGADAVLTHPAGARLWLSYGNYEIDWRGSSRYDQRWHTWLAELVLEGRLVVPELRSFYAAIRANGLGSYDSGSGYLLDTRLGGSVGYNLEALEAYSIAIGWRFTRWTTLKVEYTHQELDLVRGAGSAFGHAADDADFFGAELQVAF